MFNQNKNNNLLTLAEYIRTGLTEDEQTKIKSTSINYRKTWMPRIHHSNHLNQAYRERNRIAKIVKNERK